MAAEKVIAALNSESGRTLFLENESRRRLQRSDPAGKPSTSTSAGRRLIRANEVRYCPPVRCTGACGLVADQQPCSMTWHPVRDVQQVRNNTPPPRHRGMM
jgi:hypothetical protein